MENTVSITGRFTLVPPILGLLPPSIIIITISCHSRILMGSSGFSSLLLVLLFSMLVDPRVLVLRVQSSCDVPSASCFTRLLGEGFGKAICNAHHNAVRALRVEAVSSLMAAARARTSATEKCLLGKASTRARFITIHRKAA